MIDISDVLERLLDGCGVLAIKATAGRDHLVYQLPVILAETSLPHPGPQPGSQESGDLHMWTPSGFLPWGCRRWQPLSHVRSITSSLSLFDPGRRQHSFSCTQVKDEQLASSTCLACTCIAVSQGRLIKHADDILHSTAVYQKAPEAGLTNHDMLRCRHSHRALHTMERHRGERFVLLPLTFSTPGHLHVPCPLSM